MIPYLLATILAAFGFITFFLSSSLIFDLFGIRAKQGNYVPIVVWANFISSIFYLFSAYGFVRNRKWTSKLLKMTSALLIAAFAGFIIHVSNGGIYETKTIGAMIFRIAITLGFAILANYTINKHRKRNSQNAPNNS